jgi:hypothetical protein
MFVKLFVVSEYKTDNTVTACVHQGVLYSYVTHICNIYMLFTQMRDVMSHFGQHHTEIIYLL